MPELQEGSLAAVTSSLRLGMNRVKGLRQEDAEAIATAVKREGPFTSVEALWRASGTSTRAMKLLARADAFASMGLDRQSALWHSRKLRDEQSPLFDFKSQSPLRDRPVPLPRLPELRQVIHDYGTIGLSLRPHPISFLRGFLDTRRAVTAVQVADAAHFPSGRGVTVAGLCLVRQHPGTAKGITFMTLEDETGVVNLVVRPQVYDRYRRLVRTAGSLLVRGRIDRANEVVHVIATSMESLDDRLTDLRSASRDFH